MHTLPVFVVCLILTNCSIWGLKFNFESKEHSHNFLEFYSSFFMFTMLNKISNGRPQFQHKFQVFSEIKNSHSLLCYKARLMFFVSCRSYNTTVVQTNWIPCASVLECKAGWDAAARRNNCSRKASTQKCSAVDQFLYHCIINGYRNVTLEVCAPSIIIFGNYSIYN